jgi:hypothetical protein
MLVHSAAFPIENGCRPDQVRYRSQAREIFASSHALASPADEAVRFRVMVEVGKADA